MPTGTRRGMLAAAITNSVAARLEHRPDRALARPEPVPVYPLQIRFPADFAEEGDVCANRRRIRRALPVIAGTALTARRWRRRRWRWLRAALSGGNCAAIRTLCRWRRWLWAALSRGNGAAIGTLCRWRRWLWAALSRGGGAAIGTLCRRRRGRRVFLVAEEAEFPMPLLKAVFPVAVVPEGLGCEGSGFRLGGRGSQTQPDQRQATGRQ
jgi:hypothetical protein